MGILRNLYRLHLSFKRTNPVIIPMKITAILTKNFIRAVSESIFEILFHIHNNIFCICPITLSQACTIHIMKKYNIWMDKFQYADPASARHPPVKNTCPLAFYTHGHTAGLLCGNNGKYHRQRQAIFVHNMNPSWQHAHCLSVLMISRCRWYHCPCRHICAECLLFPDGFAFGCRNKNNKICGGISGSTTELEEYRNAYGVQESCG